MVKISMIKLALVFLKIGVSSLINDDALNRIFEECADYTINESIDWLKKFMSEGDISLSINDLEMEKNEIPREKRKEIRNNIINFIRNIDVEEIASKYAYDEIVIGEVLATEFKNEYNFDTDYDYRYHQRMLYSVANYVVNRMKAKDNFNTEILMECYKMLIALHEKQEENTICKRQENVSLIKKNDFELIIDSLINKKNSKSPFHYLYADIDIYGRENEITALEAFVNSPGKFMFWGILGPGGIGKSKLAYSFIKRYENDDEWKMVFFPSKKIKEATALSNWEYSKNLLIIIDYAGTLADDIGEWMQKLASTTEHRKRKIRLLFLERQGYKMIYDEYTGEEKYIAPDWYYRLCNPRSEGIYADEESLQEFQYLRHKYPTMLSLEALGQKASFALMDSYASALGKRCLSNHKKLNVLEFFENNGDNNWKGFKITPLYILFVTDAALCDENFRNWDRKKLMDYVYKRDYKIWEKSIKEDKLLLALMEILIYTTVVKEWQIGKPLCGLLKKSEIIINKYRKQDEIDCAYEWIHVLTGRVQDTTLLPVMGAIEPDLVGEYYVLTRLKRYSDEGIREWCKIWLETPEACNEFFFRCIQDYGKDFWEVLLKILTAMNEVLLEKNQVAVHKKEIESVAFLWLQYYKYVLPLPSNEPRARMQEFVRLWRNESQDVAELYTIIFCRDSIIRGQQKKVKFIELDKLYERWTNSAIIAKTYVDIIAELITYYFGSGQVDKSNDLIDVLKNVITQWGTKNEEVAISCANALEVIIPIQYQFGNREEGRCNIDILNNLLNNWENENFALYFIVLQGDLAITQNSLDEKMECEKTLMILCEMLKRWGNRNDGIAWRSVDVIAKVLMRLNSAIKKEIRFELLKSIDQMVCNSSELSKGVLWHFAKTLDRIAVIKSISYSEILYITEIQEKCYILIQ